jgi:hypothetical protein
MHLLTDHRLHTLIPYNVKSYEAVLRSPTRSWLMNFGGDLPCRINFARDCLSPSFVGVPMLTHHTQFLSRLAPLYFVSAAISGLGNSVKLGLAPLQSNSAEVGCVALRFHYSFSKDDFLSEKMTISSFVMVRDDFLFLSSCVEISFTKSCA